MDARSAKVDITERTVAFSLRVIQLVRELDSGGIGRILGRQLLRSGTSVGANVHEAQGGQSKADFIAKISVAHEEALETVYWLRLIRDSGLIAADRIAALTDEIDQLVKILSKILVTSKGRRKSSV